MIEEWRPYLPNSPASFAPPYLLTTLPYPPYPLRRRVGLRPGVHLNTSFPPLPLRPIINILPLPSPHPPPPPPPACTGFMQRHDPAYICNTSDDSGRYEYAKQPEMCRWNCEKLGEALRALLPLEASREELPHFDSQYAASYLQIMRRKLGLIKVRSAWACRWVAWVGGVWEGGSLGGAGGEQSMASGRAVVWCCTLQCGTIAD